MQQPFEQAQAESDSVREVLAGPPAQWGGGWQQHPTTPWWGGAQRMTRACWQRPHAGLLIGPWWCFRSTARPTQSAAAVARREAGGAAIDLAAPALYWPWHIDTSTCCLLNPPHSSQGKHITASTHPAFTFQQLGYSRRSAFAHANARFSLLRKPKCTLSPHFLPQTRSQVDSRISVSARLCSGGLPLVFGVLG